MVSTRLLWFLLLGPVLLLWTGCDPEDDDPTVTCDYTIPRLLTSDAAACQNLSVEFTQLNSPQGTRGPALPLPCNLVPRVGSAQYVTRTALLQVPQASTDPLNFFIYNGSAGEVVAQVFGGFRCGIEPRPVSECYRSFATVGTFTVFDVAQYEELYLHLTFVERGDEQPFAANDDSYVEVVVKGELPTPTTIPYRTNEDSNDPSRRSIILSCDGSSSNRLVYFACEENTDIEEVGTALGLIVDDQKQERSGTLGALIFPNGSDPAKAKRSTEAGKEELEENGTGGLFGSVEIDHLIRYRELDIDPVLLPQENPIIQGFEGNLRFEVPRGGSGMGDDIVVSVIDSGTDADFSSQNFFRDFTYQGSPATCIFPNRLGYDYFDRDALPEDRLSHGYSVASALVSQYTGDRGLAVVHHKIFDGQGRAFYFDALTAVLESITIESDLINASWGFRSQEVPAALDCMLGIAARASTLVVASAGNDTTNIDLTLQWPAAFTSLYPRTVYSVATYNGDQDFATYRRAPYSNFGRQNVAITAFVPEVPTLEGGAEFRAGTSYSAPLFARDLLRYLERGFHPFDPNFGSYPRTPNLEGTSRNGTFLSPDFERDGSGLP